MLDYKVKNKITPLSLSSVRMGGYEGALLDTFFGGRVFSDYARNDVYREAEDAFKNCIDDLTCIGIWQGEYWGKWVISAARVARYQHNEELKSFVRSAAWELISLRDSEGCISTYRDPNVFSAAPVEEVVTLPETTVETKSDEETTTA